MSEFDINRLTSAQQIAVMQNLSQQAAAWLVGATARTVRDHPEIPRDTDGNYNAQDLLAWAASRVPPAELEIMDLERTLNLADLLFDTLHQRNGMAAIALHDLLQGLRERYGEGGLMVFTLEMLRQLRQRADLVRDEINDRKLSPEELRREIERRVESELADRAEWDAEADLDFAVVCDGCGRLRRGWEWIKADPEPGRHVIRGCCPEYTSCNPNWPARRRKTQ